MPGRPRRYALCPMAYGLCPIQRGIIMKNILLIGDTVSACRVALSAMEPVLIKAGFNVTCLQTAIVSATFGYKGVAVHNTGDYVEKALDFYEKSGFDFDAIYVGYLTHNEQARAITRYCKAKAARGKTIFLDPVMGEECHLYYGMGDENRQYFKELLPYADYILPSYTEAAFLTGEDYTKHPADRGRVLAITEKLAALGAKNMAVTSCVIEGRDFTALHNARTATTEFLPCDVIPVKVAGTGDLFAAYFMANILSGHSLTAATRKAMDSVRYLVDINKNKADKMRGIDTNSII